MAERTYMRQYIRVSNYKNIYQSEPYSVLDYTGDIGGIVSAIQLVFTFIISGIVYPLYITDLISETYQVQKYRQDKDEYYISGKGQNNASLSSNIESDKSNTEDFQNKKIGLIATPDAKGDKTRRNFCDRSENPPDMQDPEISPSKKAKNLKKWLKASKRYISEAPTK